MQKIKPFRSLDAFRGLAALWVVMVHSCAPWLDKHQSYYSQPLYAVSMKGQLGVVLFFVISGYCITAAVYAALVSGKTLGRYFFERFRRIYPPYLFALVLTGLSDLALHFAEKRHLVPPIHHSIALGTTPVYWLGNLFLLQYELHTEFINVVFWSLCYEIAFYFLMGLFLFGAARIARSKGLQPATLFLVSSVAVSTILSLSFLIIFHRETFPFDLWHLFTLGGLLFFALEINPLTASHYTAGLRRLIWGSTGVVCLLTLVYGALRQVGMLDPSHPSTKVRSITAVLFCFILVSIRRFDERLSQHRLLHPFVWMGAFSYSLYLIHPVVLPFVDILMRKAGFNGNQYLITFAGEIIVSVIAGRLMFLAVERYFISKRQGSRLVSEHAIKADSLAA